MGEEIEKWREPWLEQNPNTKNWHLRWREEVPGEDGKPQVVRKSRVCKDHADAKNQLKRFNQMQMAERETTDNPSKALEPLFETYMRNMEQIRELRPSTLRNKRMFVTPYVETTEILGEVNRTNLLKYRDELFTEELEPVSIAGTLREIKAFVRWLFFEGHLKVNPWVNIEIPTYEPTPRFFTNDELGRLEANCAVDGRLKAIVRLAYLTGMRRNEILSLRWEDIREERGKNPVTGKAETRLFITIWSKTAKNHRSRTIPLRREVVDLLGSRRPGQVFQGWTKSKLRRGWEALVEAAKIEARARFHDLRHTFCRLYLEGGGTIADLMAITGHQSINMMRIYAHFEVRHLTERLDAIAMPEIEQTLKSDAKNLVSPDDEQTLKSGAKSLMPDSVGRWKDNPPAGRVIQGDFHGNGHTDQQGGNGGN